jgi:tRNA(Ile2) C34 agmatinyltransferase TiaS
MRQCPTCGFTTESGLTCPVCGRRLPLQIMPGERTLRKIGLALLIPVLIWLAMTALLN